MLRQSLLALASAALALGSPVARSEPISCRAPMPDPTLPTTGGAAELPPVPQGLELKLIALGLGIQNYTCASVGAAAESTGALAMFYDISLLYPGSGPGSLSAEKFSQLPAFALNHHDVPLRFNDSADGRVDASSPGASLKRPFTRAAPLDLGEYGALPFLGHHFFNTDGAPTFILQRGSFNIVAAKKAAVPPPGSSDPGPMGTGAVAWLALDATSNSRGATLVYRVETAGGNSHGCSRAAGQDSTSYAAQYWFYGPV
ncbi:malate dehydrogenase [Trichoderma cornu-damae]|uniref:Malate dehydrogenase n=1 Tax=Trichoderma cornu-damae TaxID=654480 RepID=A0A9P8QGI5_9HYPO|nr:malate dehydrogenase [Trichoderma cornu-damae]